MLYIGAVKGDRGLRDTDPIRKSLQSLIDPGHMGHRHIAAAAAALDIVKGRFAEERCPGPSGKRQQTVVLKKYDPFAGRLL